ncbi:N/A [soil metagenome]
MNVAIALPVLADGDAVGNDALGMANVLRADGHTVTLFAEKSLVAEDVLPLSSLAVTANDFLIYHHSHGCEAGVAAALSFTGRVAVKYHNVTPAKFFPAGSEVRAAAESGLMQAATLARGNACFWVDSSFNADGLPRVCDTLPPFMQTESLIGCDIDADTASNLESWVTTFLTVGRIAPNKNLLLAIDALTEYRQDDANARLVIAGGHVFPEYSEAVTQRIRDRGLESNVIITGRVTVPQLKTLYLAADVLLVPSEHEGFCVPLVEAMALNVPVIAVKNAAIPDTAGDAAMLVKSDAQAIAAAMRQCVQDRDARDALMQRGQSRYQTTFTRETIAKRFRELMAH